MEIINIINKRFYLFVTTGISKVKQLLAKPTSSEIGWLISGQALAIILGFISMKLLTSMGTAEFGKYSLVLSIAAFVSIIFYGPAEQGFIRFYYHYANKGKSRTFIGLFYTFLLQIGLAFLAVTLLSIFLNLFVKTSQTSLGILIIGLYTISSCSSNLHNSMLNLLRKRKTNAILQVLERSLTILFLYIVTLFFKLTAYASFLAISIMLSVVLWIKIRVLSKSIPNDLPAQNWLERNNDKKEILNVIATFAFPFAIWGLSGWVQSNSERWIIAQYLSTSDVGIFSIMAILASYLVAIPSGIISQFMQPIIYENMLSINDVAKRARGKIFFNYFIFFVSALTVFSTLFAVLFGKFTILLISSEAFVTYWYVLPLLCLGMGLFNIAQALTTLGLLGNVPKIYLWPKITTAGFSLLSNIFLVSKMGILGIAISICISSTLYLLGIVYANSKLKQPLIKSEFNDERERSFLI